MEPQYYMSVPQRPSPVIPTVGRWRLKDQKFKVMVNVKPVWATQDLVSKISKLIN